MNQPLGHRLKAARESRGLSLMDAAHETRIPVTRLQHLEAENYAAFGSMTYARSFLKLYSDFLGVNASEVLDELPSAMLGGPQDYRHLVDSFGPWLPEKSRRVEKLAEPEVSRVRTIKSPVPAALAVFVCVLAASGIFGKYVMDSQRTLTEQQAALEQRLPTAEAQPMATANESPAADQVQVAVPVDPITLEPKPRTYPVSQPGDGL
ncbi:MAG: helix-turn-helix domain-containing protein [Prosthecobacter sp.]|jgi:cytoskeletal protein RodZ